MTGCTRAGGELGNDRTARARIGRSLCQANGPFISRVSAPLPSRPAATFAQRWVPRFRNGQKAGAARSERPTVTAAARLRYSVRPSLRTRTPCELRRVDSPSQRTPRERLQTQTHRAGGGDRVFKRWTPAGTSRWRGSQSTSRCSKWRSHGRRTANVHADRRRVAMITKLTSQCNWVRVHTSPEATTSVASTPTSTRHSPLAPPVRRQYPRAFTPPVSAMLAPATSFTGEHEVVQFSVARILGDAEERAKSDVRSAPWRTRTLRCLSCSRAPRAGSTAPG